MERIWQLPALNKIGPEQFADLLKTTPVVVLGQMVNATIVAAALYPVSGKKLLAAWWLSNLAVCMWTMFSWRKNRNRNLTRVSPKALKHATISGFLFAAPWGALSLVYLGDVPPGIDLIIAVSVAGMAAGGSIQLARIYPAALAYLATIFLPVFIKCLSLGGTNYYLLMGLSISYIVYLFTVIANSATTSIERSTALQTLETKVSQIDEVNSALEKLASEDDLTGLPNRRVFHQRLAASLNEARRLGNSISLLVCDLDHFKNINDMSGHEAGDHLLCEIARRLQSTVREFDTVARIGGDEFAIIIKHQHTPKDTMEFIQRLMAAVNKPVDIGGTSVNPGISIGVSMFPFDAQTPEVMLLHADLALQRGKSISRGQFWFFDHHMRSKLTSDTALEADLRIALAQEQFELFYQPKIDIRTGHLAGFETLIRWRKSNGDVVSPGTFFNVAEERGLMPHINDFVVEQAIDDIAGWMDMGLDPGGVAINIHPAQIKDRHRMLRLARDVEKKSIPPEKFILEITEECVVGRGTETVPEILDLMRRHNFKVSLDDFGTGYASLTQLKTLPVDEIKLDRSFIMDLMSSPSDRAIVHAMIKLADSLGLTTVAEGIENREQHNVLLAMGCSIGQGYHYARPMDLEAATQYLINARKAQKPVAVNNVTRLVSPNLRSVAGETKITG